MKRVLTYLFAAGMMISAASLMFTSCTKEGPQGPAGANGADGTNGQDANATCTQCHNFSELIVAKILQYDNSFHGTGLDFERNAANCAPCHTSQGFQEVLETGLEDCADAIQNPAPPGCRTCHMIHDSYTTTDWDLRVTSAFTNRLGQPQDMAVEYEGALYPSGNLCARCHQARVASPPVTNPTSTTDSIVIASSNSRWGPHHGPQGLILAGLGGFETGAKFTNSWHTGKTACVFCHGAEAFGAQAGGHTLNMTYDSHGTETDNVKGCNMTNCHVGLTTFDYGGKQTIIEGKTATLLAQLQAANVLNASALMVPGTYCEKMMATVWNFNMVEADRSMGVHNYKYVDGMLDEGIAYLTSLGY